MLMRYLIGSMCLVAAGVLACSYAGAPRSGVGAQAQTEPPTSQPASQPDVATEKITIGEETFKLEVAANADSRARGLSNRKEIAADGGMIFIYPNVKHRSFWMRYCLVDIDIAFANGRGVITAMHEMKPDPPRRDDEPEYAYEQRLKRYASRRNAQFALEFKAGTLRRLKLKVGDRLDMDLKRLKALSRKKPDSNTDADKKDGAEDKEISP